MPSFTLRPIEPATDFGQLAAWFSILEDEPSTEAELKAYYENNQERISQAAAVDELGDLAGFYWAARDRVKLDRAFCTVFVRPEQRQQGIGRRLYEHMLEAAQAGRAACLQINLWDNCPECRAFAERRGFVEKRHRIAMELDLAGFDDSSYDAIIHRLEGEGFQFTSMAALGDTEDAQRKLYALNETTAMTTLGADGEPSWASFEDFRDNVCRTSWYMPGGQIVAIDTATGVWAAMSAITRFEGTEHAYNLFTGVDTAYRGRKLGQAVKVTALRYAREVLGVTRVRTHHNTQNLPMIAIDRKLGYVQKPGVFLMEKILE